MSLSETFFAGRYPAKPGGRAVLSPSTDDSDDAQAQVAAPPSTSNNTSAPPKPTAFPFAVSSAHHTMKDQMNTPTATSPLLAEKMKTWSLSHGAEARCRRALRQVERAKQQNERRTARQQESERRKIAWAVDRLLRHAQKIVGGNQARAITLVQQHLATYDTSL